MQIRASLCTNKKIIKSEKFKINLNCYKKNMNKNRKN